MSKGRVNHILLINGWSAPSAIWNDFFSSGFEGCSVDVLSLTTQTSIDECNVLIDLHIKPGTLIIAWSLGGQLAINYLVNYQTGVSNRGRIVGCVFLQSTPCFVNQGTWQSGVNPDDFTSLQNLLESRELAELVRRFSYLMLSGSQYRKQDRKLLASLYNVERLASNESLGFGLALLKEFDLRSLLTHLSLPYVWILGKNDSLIKADMDRFFELFQVKDRSSGALHVIDEMGHFPCGQHAGEVKDKIVQFMEGL